MGVARRNPTPRMPLGLQPRTIFVTGKGGVGKTTIAAALAMAFRDAGARTLLVEIEGHEGAAALISDRPVGYEAVTISPKLWALRIDAEGALQEYARLQLKVKMIADRMARNPIFAQFAQVAAGLRELLTLGKLWALSEERTSRGPRYEAIIVDAPATGHGLSLMTTAGSIAKAFPVGPIASQAKQVDAFIRNPDLCSTILVALAEEVATNEALDLHEQLAANELHVGGVIANGLLPHRFNSDQGGKLEWLSSTLGSSKENRRVTSLLDVALYEHARATEQSEQLHRLDALDGRAGTIVSLPYLYADSIGRTELSLLAAQLTDREIETQSTSTSQRGAHR
jgi:anion-transporting  ArsA/GET3 family ATPase